MGDPNFDPIELTLFEDRAENVKRGSTPNYFILFVHSSTVLATFLKYNMKLIGPYENRPEALRTGS